MQIKIDLDKAQEREIEEVAEETDRTVEEVVMESLGTYLTLRHQQAIGGTIAVVRGDRYQVVILT